MSVHVSANASCMSQGAPGERSAIMASSAAVSRAFLLSCHLRLVCAHAVVTWVVDVRRARS
eukprot:1669688-Prymnesium_polylepis.2